MHKKRVRLFIAFVIAGFFTSCTPKSAEKPAPAHFMPVGGQETVQPQQVFNAQTQQDLQPILNIGKRAVEWLNLVNQNRNLETRLNLADRNTKNPVPPEAPKVTNVKLMLEKFNARLMALPPEMKPFLLTEQMLVEVPPVTDEVFIKMMRELNSSYQGAIRWLGQEAYFDNYYAHQDVKDIRGYYFFMKDPAAVEGLKQFSNLDPDTKAKYTEWLISMCHNSLSSKEDCRREVATYLSQDKAYDYYQRYFNLSKETYDSFFQMRKTRDELKWNQEGTELTQDFIAPSLQKISAWLKTNIEEEWKFAGFQLLLRFIPENMTAPFITFEKGVTPHASGATWNEITMDPDYSLDDYNTQWTIRHEFGHVLGFPDCYLEFYDKASGEMVYYTIEVDNLMCAWGGKLQGSHVDELRRVYK
jgi:hypothetical protein